jgi:tetratricopeptide (TPR) repeat protein
MLLGILLAACMVPERLHLSEIVATANGDIAATIARRIDRDGFEAVARSLDPNGSDTGYRDLGWLTRDDPLVAPGVASAPVGATVSDVQDPIRYFFHVEARREAMSCDAAIARDPADLIALLARAAAESQTGKADAAIADYSTAIRIDPASYAARYGRGSIFYARGEYDRALEDAQAAVSALGASGSGHVLLALVEEARGDDDLATAEAAEAIAEYQGHLQNAAGGHYALGAAYADLGYYAAAVDEFGEVLTSAPNDATTLVARGHAWFAIGDVTKAERDFTAAANRGPAQPTPFLGLAIVQFANGETRAARANAEKALAASPREQYAALWILICDRALHRRADPQAAALASSSTWPAPVLRAFAGRATVAALERTIAAADPRIVRNQTCEARFYRALYLHAGGDAQHAIPLLRLAARECPYNEYERAAAQLMLERLELRRS